MAAGAGADRTQTLIHTRAAARPRLGSHLKGLIDSGPAGSWVPRARSRFITLPALHIWTYFAVCKAPLQVDRTSITGSHIFPMKKPKFREAQ